ncbi:surface glycan-binding family protein [uncultured Bacteroides sp.]|uniref:surface glycan-binding family protein n=1 Tax=uncultured Bacteroides sp. TaxID=162156 RepID=UPI002597F54D|nr:surface glycan-binding family protein [uncultured Bacteroides sp.]
MKSKLLSTFSMLRVLMVAALTVFCVSCDKTETTDSTGFILYYMGVTDIGPGLSYDLQAPAYKGSAPYDFTITNITLDEETFSNDENFVINTETGAIAIQNTGAMASGLYSISVGCYSNGKFFEFKDAVQVNMLLAAPEGVTIEPDKVIVVNQDEEKWVETSAQVTTEKDKHISILGYTIAQDESKPYLQYFDVTSTGKIIIKESVTEDQLIAGEEYTLSLKLTTKAGDHMFADAVTFKIVSKPRKLVYDLGERGYNLYEEKLAWESDAPQFKGGKEDLKFAIKSITPEVSGFIINETTGQISLPENHIVAASEDIYSFTITVSNSYGTVDFENAYKAKVTTKINPIENFSYEAGKEIYQLGGELTVTRADGFTGDPEKFVFAADNTDEDVVAHYYKKIIQIDKNNGTITIANNHTLSAGNHTIKVEASNMKGSVTAELTINVLENPNDFTYVSWGTNMENPIITDGKTAINTETKKETQIKYRNQFRFIHNRAVVDLTVKGHDFQVGSTISYHISDTERIGSPSIFEGINISQDGSITFKKQSSTDKAPGAFTGSNYLGAIFLVEVTAQGNNAPSVTKKIPIFISTPKAETVNNINHTILCDPFVIKVNPKTGYCDPINYKIHKIRGKKIDNIQNNFSEEILSDNKLIWDYISDYLYCNFDDNTQHATNTKRITDNSSDANKMLYQVWKNCGSSTSIINTFMNYYNQKDNVVDNNWAKKAGYIDAENGHQLSINFPKWIGSDGKYPYGAMMGLTKYNIDGSINNLSVSKASVSTYPFFIWFDETYEGN